MPEFIHYHDHNGSSSGEGGARRWEGTGSISSFLKLFFFLGWAARQPEQERHCPCSPREPTRRMHMYTFCG